MSDLVCGEVLDSWRIGEGKIVVVTVEGFHMSKERDETGLVRAACWQLCDAKDSYSCAILCEGWGSVVELWGGRRGQWQGKRRSGWWGHRQHRWRGLLCLEQDCWWLYSEQMQHYLERARPITFLSTPICRTPCQIKIPRPQRRELSPWVYQAVQVEPCPVTNCPCLIAIAVNKRQTMTITLLPLMAGTKYQRQMIANDRQISAVIQWSKQSICSLLSVFQAAYRRP